MSNWYSPSNLWSGAKQATGVTNIGNAWNAAQQGDWSTAARQGAAGLGKAALFAVPGGMALRAGVGGLRAAQGAGALARLGAGGRATVAGPRLLGGGSRARTVLGFETGGLALGAGLESRGILSQRAAADQRSQQAQAGRYQGLADQFSRVGAAGQPTFANDPFLQFQPGMVSPFSPEGIQQAGTQVAMNQFGQQLAGLQPTQAAFFQSQLDAALRDRDRALGDIGEQESAVRRQTAQAGRRTRAAGAGEAADLQAAAAARGLMSSPASFDVGQDFIAATTAAEQAGQQASLSSFLGQAERARGQVESDYRQFMDDVRRDRLARQMENQQAQQDRLMGLLSYL